MTKEELERVVKQAKAYQDTWPEWKKKWIKENFEFHGKKTSEFYKTLDNSVEY